MIKRPLGDTGLSVSVLGLGTVKLGRNTQVKFPQPFELPSDREVRDLLVQAHDLGITLLDTAPAYGKSEQRLGQLLPYSRDHWLISSKVGEQFDGTTSCYDFSASALTRQLHASLNALRTDYLDIVLVHSDGNDVDIIEQYDVFSTLSGFKQQGLIRAFGMSTKTVAGGLLTVKHADVVMVTFHVQHTAERAVIDAAAEANKGVLIKKALASGHGVSAPQGVQAALAFALQPPGVSSVVLGTINPQHLQENCAAMHLL